MFTLCVPTLNRSEFLARLLNYYTETGYRHVIFIGDSSDEHHAAQNRKIVGTLADRIKIEYHHLPGLSSNACLEQLSKLIKTPYCGFVADDDLLCMGGIERCVNFLETDSNYGSVHGKGIILSVSSGEVFGEVLGARHYPQAIITADTAVNRLQEYFNRSLYALLFSVHRTANWQAMFQGVSKLKGVRNQNIFKDELIASSVSVIRGKTKELDCLYLVRQAHGGIIKQPDAYSWITSADWYPSFQYFCRRLTDELVLSDGISSEEAKEAIKRAFWPYLSNILSVSLRKKERRPGTKIKKALPKFIGAAKQIPGARKFWQRIKSLNRDPFSLLALLDKTSPYHDDFMPIYRAITNKGDY